MLDDDVVDGCAVYGGEPTFESATSLNRTYSGPAGAWKATFSVSYSGKLGFAPVIWNESLQPPVAGSER